MKQQIEQRLQQLKSEFTDGQKILSALEARQTNVRETLTRISGAIQVLEELLNEVEVTQDSSKDQASMSDASAKAVFTHTL